MQGVVAYRYNLSPQHQEGLYNSVEYFKWVCTIWQHPTSNNNDKRIIISLKISLSGSHLKRIQFFIPWVMARQRQSQQPTHYGKVRKIFYVLDAEFVWIAKSVNVHLWFFSRVLREGFWNKFHSLITKFLVSESFMKITYNLLGKASQCGGIKNIILNSEYSLQNIFCAMYWCAQLLIF